MLDGGNSVAGYNNDARDGPFRPIAAPSFSYKSTTTTTTTTAAVVDTNNVVQQQQEQPNRRVLSGPVPSQSSRSVVRPKPSIVYKVQEEQHAHHNEPRPSDRMPIYGTAVRQSSLRDKPVVDQPPQQTKSLQQHHQDNSLRRYAAFSTSSEPTIVNKYYYKTSSQPPSPPSPPLAAAAAAAPSAPFVVDQQLNREYYPATKVPPTFYSPYDSAGKQYESDKLTGSRSGHLKEPASSAATFPPVSNVWSLSANPTAESADLDDVNAKDVLKSLLRDMLTSKQRKPSGGGLDEVIESYYKNNKGSNVGQAFGLDDYDIETGESDIGFTVNIYLLHFNTNEPFLITRGKLS